MTLVSNRGTVGGLLQRTGTDRLYKNGSGSGVIQLYGATSTLDATFDLDAADGGAVRAYTAAGFPLATCSAASTWGNAAILADLDTLYANHASIFKGQRVHLMGYSMGAQILLNWALANPDLVLSMLGVIPVIDVQDIYTNNRSGFAAAISAAHGGAPPDSANPADNAASFEFPIRLYYSTDDPVCIPQTILDFVATAPNAEAVSMGAVSHFWGSPFTNAAAAEFFVENDA